jgi:hypothetical protein
VTTSRPSYCAVADVWARMFAEEGTDVSTGNPQLVDFLTTLAAMTSRRFDQETGRLPGGFAPTYDRRLYSGEGMQQIEVDEFAILSKIEVNLSPITTGPQTWTDVTGEIAQGGIAARPLRGWPKTELFRMQTFYPDPYLNGNVRLTGVFGAAQPDLGAAAPAVPWGSLTTQAEIIAVQPVDPVTGVSTGWWIVPEDVLAAVADWTVYAYRITQAGYGEQAGQPSGGAVQVPRKIPQQVQDVIAKYTSGRIHLAMIGLDGTDFRDEIARPGTSLGQPGQSTRWAAWQSFTPPGP